jgi:hypothetical protein
MMTIQAERIGTRMAALTPRASYSPCAKEHKIYYLKSRKLLTARNNTTTAFTLMDKFLHLSPKDFNVQIVVQIFASLL